VGGSAYTVASARGWAGMGPVHPLRAAVVMARVVAGMWGYGTWPVLLREG